MAGEAGRRSSRSPASWVPGCFWAWRKAFSSMTTARSASSHVPDASLVAPCLDQRSWTPLYGHLGNTRQLPPHQYRVERLRKSQAVSHPSGSALSHSDAKAWIGQEYHEATFSRGERGWKRRLSLAQPWRLHCRRGLAGGTGLTPKQVVLINGIFRRTHPDTLMYSLTLRYSHWSSNARSFVVPSTGAHGDVRVV